MARGGRGRIVNVTSVCAQRGYSGLVAYSATKGGLDSAARTLAREMHGRVLVNASRRASSPPRCPRCSARTQLDQITRRTPSGRLDRARRHPPASSGMLLLEDTNINGQVLTVDGGASI